MKLSTILKWVTGGCEALLAIPFIGGLFVVGSGWNALLFMFVAHLITLIFAVRDNRTYAGSVLGMITSALAWIPVLGWILHSVTAIFLLIDAGRATSLDKKA
ncbi:hypothetical protein JF544_11910 [Halobacillus kuroshimensis]|uniref:Uncharacterized protein n=1 Tax=Halobacillus kuroshimensis TaxID=302481 RepID=A0ABS3DXA7_9BACI|nr:MULTISPECIES: hypothetical protein [Halobacillus]MBN8235961.1 hypothetical protein [Halobacillus kuroshimensis]